MRALFQLTSVIVIGLLSPNAIAWIDADVCEFETSNKITSSGSESQFGIRVAMDGDTALISALNNGQGGSTSIFNKLADGSWSESQQIQPADGQPNSAFGRSIDIDGDTAIIGDPYVDSNGGRAYIFERQSDGTWAETQSFDPPSIACQWGYSVAISGNYALVGGPGFDEFGGNQDYGAVKMYVRQSDGYWEEQNGIMPSDLQYQAKFGSSISISGDVAIIGARGDWEDDAGSGSAYLIQLFSNGTWEIISKISASDAAGSDRFGTSVAIDGTVAIIGAPENDDSHDNSGSAYIFERQSSGQWLEIQKLVAFDATAWGWFGESVALEDGIAIIGADRHPGGGCAYTAEQDGDGSWSITSKLVSSGNENYFGASAAISGNDGIVGAWGGSSGSAYLFSLADCDQNNILDSCDLESGTSQDCNSNNIPDECDIANGISDDCNANGVPDSCETDCNSNDIPDECDIENGYSTDCNSNGIPDSCDLDDATSVDCNGNGVPDSCDLADGVSTDCNGNNVPDSCDIADGTSNDCNGNGIPDTCDLAEGNDTDCNSNGSLDTCDIANGTSTDCDSNGLLDECESFTDCNLNGILDLCDIINGTSLDNDGDGIPDECFCDDLTQTLDYTDLIFTSSGKDLAMDGSYAVTLSVNENASGSLRTYVEIFKNQSGQWEHEHTHLSVSTIYNGQYFPNKRIAIDNEQIIFISPTNSSLGDSVIEILSKVDGEWPIAAELISSTAYGSSYPVVSVDISGDVAVIGHPAQDASEGRVLVYRRYGNSWAKEAELTQSLGPPASSFGIDVAVDGNTIMVCSPSHGPWIYEFNGQNWVETQFVELEDINTGSTIDLDGDLCVVGSFHQYPTDCSVLRRVDGQWELEQQLTSEDSTTERLGYAVRISGNTILASSGRNYSTYPPGKAHVFQHDGTSWMETRIYEEPKISDDLWLSSPRIALSGNQVALGFIDKSNTEFTSIDIHTLSQSSIGIDCNQNDICDSLDIASGTSEDCDGNGVPDTCDIADGMMDVDLDGILDLCEQDCDGDQWPDDYEIEQGLELDCNANGVPDSCDIINGLSPDVDEDGIPDECGEGYIIQVSNSDENPFMSIQAALDFSIPGSTILVQAGIYNGSMVFPDHPVHLISESGAQDTIIQGSPGSSVLVITGNNHNGTLVQGFTITAGVASNGGGILISDGCPTIVDCIFEENMATQSGGGAYIVNAAPLFLDCEFIGNIGPYGGGGMCVRGHYPGETPVKLADCLFLENKVNGPVEGGFAQPGGGGLVTYQARIDINGCRFDLNEATGESSSYRFGGGIDAREATLMRIDDSSFSYNVATYGRSIETFNNSVDGPPGQPPIYGIVEISDTTSCIPAGASPNTGHIFGGYEDLGGNQFANDCNEDGTDSPTATATEFDECDIEDGSAIDDGIPDDCGHCDADGCLMDRAKQDGISIAT